MDIDAIVTVFTGVAGVAGGFIGGRRLGNQQAVSMAVDVVELLRVQVDVLTHKGEADAMMITELRTRVDVLESMVTQRADVEGVRRVVDRIAVKVEA